MLATERERDELKPQLGMEKIGRCLQNRITRVVRVNQLVGTIIKDFSHASDQLSNEILNLNGAII